METVIICVSVFSILLSTFLLLHSRHRLNALAAMVDILEKKVLKETAALRGQVDALQKGIIPDYEEAKAAANAVNDFSKGIWCSVGLK